MAWIGLGLWLLEGVAWGRLVDEPPVRIAVAPFAWASAADGSPSGAPLRIADALAEQLADRPIDRVIAPAAFRAQPEFEPLPATIRQWAYNAAVDTVVVGRVRVLEADHVGGSPSWEVEAVLRSGHSGAELARNQVEVPAQLDIDGAMNRLATEILAELGYTPSEDAAAGTYRDPRSPEPAALAVSDPDAEAGAGGVLGGDFELGSLREDAPIEINAEEAEIVDRGTDRKLVFQRNVRVRQGNVRLASDVLEAEYRKGESEPDRLIAKGSVEVDQGFRHARCDRAVYQRIEQRLSCEGHAELVQGCDVVRGNSIEFDLAGDQAHVIGAASIVIRPRDADGEPCDSLEGSL